MRKRQARPVRFRERRALDEEEVGQDLFDSEIDVLWMKKRQSKTCSIQRKMCCGIRRGRARPVRFREGHTVDEEEARQDLFDSEKDILWMKKRQGKTCSIQRRTYCG